MNKEAISFARLTYVEAERAAVRNAVLILPVGAIEPHGPHLPLDTDVIISTAMAEMAAWGCRGAGVETYVLPPVSYTVTEFARGFRGAVSVTDGSVCAFVAEICEALVHQGFKRIALANAHLEPDHLDALHDVVARVLETTGVEVIFPDLTSKRWGRMLGEEFRSGACHAGRFETSIVMASRPEAVREKERLSLPPNPVSLSRKIREGATTFREAGGPQAYFGSPAEASPAEGLETIRTLGSILATAIQEGKSE